MLAEDYYDANEPVVDVETGQDFFCIKIKVNNSSLKNKNTDEDEFKCIKFKFNRFGMSMGKPMKRASDYERVLHDRIAPYFNLYKQFINFMTFCIVAHRNHVSMFDMLRGKWTDIKSFKDTVSYVAVKKRKKLG